MASLAGVRAKIEHAKQHFEQVNTIVRDYVAKQDRAEEVAEHEFQNDGQLIVRAKVPEPPDPRLPLVVGDCVHNLRSALDHLVLQLADLEGKANDAENKTDFPICLDARDFENAVRRKVMPFISQTALKAIENYQPFSQIDPATNTPLADRSILWVLSKLDIIDKHRVILAASQTVGVEGIEINGATGGPLKALFPTREITWKPLGADTEIIRFDLSKEVRRPLNIRVRFATGIRFVDTGLYCDGRGVQSTLNNCQQSVTQIVGYFGKQFFGE